MSDRVDEHVRLFNETVRSNDYTAFVATFTPDAEMSFVGVPAGPYHGRAAIAAAYAEQPPTDTMHRVRADQDGDTDVIAFAWDSGGTGTMRITWRDGQVARLVITFG